MDKVKFSDAEFELRSSFQSGDRIVGYNYLTLKNIKIPYDNMFETLYKVMSEITGTIAHDTDTDHDIAFGAGSCLDSSRSVMITNTALVRQIDVEFGTGNGGMYPGGSVAANTVYYMHKIMKTDGTVNIYFDISATAANKPAGYTYYRCIGAGITDASSNWHQGKWTREANKIVFSYNSFVVDRARAQLGSTSRILITVTCPPNSTGKFQWMFTNSVAQHYISFGSTDETDAAPSSYDNCKLSMFSSASPMTIIAKYKVDGSSQVYVRGDGTTDTYVGLKTEEWELVLA